MNRTFALLVVASVLVIAPQSARSQPHSEKLGVIGTFRVGDETKWDYPIIDPESRRLYIACDENVQVLDSRTGKRIGQIGDVKRAHGIAFVPGKKIGFITSGDENAVAVFDLHSLKVTQKIKMPKGTGDNPDPILYDPASRKVFALCEGGDAVAIDPANLDAPPFPIHIGGSLEYGRADGAGRIFVNNEDKNEIEVIDTKEMKLIDHWPVAPLEKPSGLAIDLKHHRLFSVGENQKMVIIDFNDGKPLGTVDIGAGCDGCAFDPKLGVAVSSNGDDGTATVVAETSAGKFAVVQTVKTAKSGRTIVDDPATSRIYIPATLPAEGRKPRQFGVFILGAAK
jgi:DNA-binding beta-propeller fold protein YncE